MSYKDASDTLRRHVKTLQALSEAADFLDKFASLENAERESDARKRTLDQAAGEAQRKLEAARLAIEEAETKAPEIIAEAQREAATHVDKAKGEAAQIRIDADREAGTLVAKAQDQADKLVAAAKLRADLSNAAALKAQAEASLELKTADAARAEYASLQAKITEARATVAKLLGG